jgi:hypothetical protein
VEPEPQSPVPVKRAVAFLRTSAFLAIAFVITVWVGLVKPPGAETSPAMVAATNFVTAALLLFVASKISKGRNWARWVLVIVVGLGVLSAAFSICVAPELWRDTPLPLHAFSLLHAALQISASILVFTSSAKQWFKGNAAL